MKFFQCTLGAVLSKRNSLQCVYYILSYPFLNEIKGLRRGGRVVVILLCDCGLYAAPDDVRVGRLLEVDEDAERNLAQEDYHQEQEELKKRKTVVINKANDIYLRYFIRGP
jgi:hypothetical protein